MKWAGKTEWFTDLHRRTNVQEEVRLITKSMRPSAADQRSTVGLMRCVPLETMEFIHSLIIPHLLLWILKMSCAESIKNCIAESVESCLCRHGPYCGLLLRYHLLGHAKVTEYKYWITTEFIIYWVLCLLRSDFCLGCIDFLWQFSVRT